MLLVLKQIFPQDDPQNGIFSSQRRKRKKFLMTNNHQKLQLHRQELPPLNSFRSTLSCYTTLLATFLIWLVAS